MKKIKLIALLVICACFISVANAQYIVTKVTGKVKTTAGDYVKPGTQLKTDERLSWSSVRDRLWVIVVGKGEKVIGPSPNATPANNLLSEVLSFSLHQDSRSGSLSGRGEIVEKIPDALHADNNSNGKIMIGLENKFLFDAQQYPQGDAGTFFIEIDLPAQRPVIRVLKTSQDTLFINYPDFVTETSNSSIKYSIGYHSKNAAGNNRLIATFIPYFDVTNEIEDMIANTIVAYQSTNSNIDAVRDSVYHNIYASSGKPNGLLFTSLFNKYWNSKGVRTNTDLPVGGTGGVFNEQEFNNTPILSTSIDVTRAELPENFSLRQYAPPVGWQGQFSSCVAWSTAYACRTITYAIQHNYSVNNQYDEIKKFSFAPDFIYNNIRRGADCTTGTAIPVALAFMRDNGNIVKSGDFVCGKTYNTTDLSDAQTFKIKDYSRVSNESMGKAELIQKMKMLLVSKHPLPFGMHLVKSFYDVQKSSGVWYPTAEERITADRVKKNLEIYVGHAMCVVGYNDAVNNGSFEVMNSWGTWNGNQGYYWINYDDFYDFFKEVYSMTDFEVQKPDAPPVAIQQPVTIKPVVETLKQPVTDPIAVTVSKPKLKGSMEFLQLRNDNTLETVPVDKKQIGARGQMVEGDNNPESYANFVLSKNFYSHDKYKIRFNLAQPAYVYIIGMDKTENYTLFPDKKINESALININNASLFLPRDNAHYTLDEVTGKERMCILVSKSPIDINALNTQFAANEHNLYQAVRKNLSKRLLEMKLGEFSTNKISFNAEVNETDVLAFFIEMNHL